MDSLTSCLTHESKLVLVQAPIRKKELKVSKDAAPSKPVAEVPVSPVPSKAKNAGLDEFALVIFHGKSSFGYLLA